MKHAAKILLTSCLIALVVSACGGTSESTSIDESRAGASSGGGSNTGGSSSGGTASGGAGADTSTGGTDAGGSGGAGAGGVSSGGVSGSGGRGTGGDIMCPPCAPPPSPDCVGTGVCGCGPYICDEVNCSELLAQLGQFLAEAQTCDPMAPDQCTNFIPSLCGCSIPVGDANSEAVTAYQGTLTAVAQKCAIACPPVACVEPTSASCISGVAGYSCVVDDPQITPY